MFIHGLLWGAYKHFSVFTFKKRNVFLLLFIIAVSLDFSSSVKIQSALAAPPPLPFDRWSNIRGQIQVNCPAGYTCTESAASENMLQRILTQNNTGITYIQVIIEDNSPELGNHSFETFVNASNASNQSIPFSEIGAIVPVTPDMNGPDIIDTINLSSSNSGIATQTNFVQTSLTSGSPNPMRYSLKLSTGWAITQGQAALDISQNITDLTPQGIDFDYTFTYTQNRDANGNKTGFLYSIDQFLRNSAVIGSGNNGTRDDQRTVIKRAAGDFIRAGSATLPSPAGGMGGMRGGSVINPANGAALPPPESVVPTPRITPFPNPPGAPTGNPMGGGGGAPPGGAVAWNTGDEVQVIWIGQVCPGCMIGMGGMGGMGGAGSASFQQYQNITSGVSAATRTIQGAAPFTWTNPPFGPQPAGL